MDSNTNVGMERMEMKLIKNLATLLSEVSKYVCGRIHTIEEEKCVCMCVFVLCIKKREKK